jgi:phage terminase large subunit GpA-like protein
VRALQGRIDDHHKPRMLRRGVWASEDQVVTPDGRVVGPRVGQARRVQDQRAVFAVGAVRQLASEWIEAQGDPNALADFINQRLAEPFEEQRAKTEPTSSPRRPRGAGRRWSSRSGRGC